MQPLVAGGFVALAPGPGRSPPPPSVHPLPPERRSSSWPRPPFVAADYGCALGSFHLTFLHSPHCSSFDSDMEGQRLRGAGRWRCGGGGRLSGIYLGNDDLFVCTGAPSPSPCFPSSSTTSFSCPGASPPPTLRHPAHSPVGTRPLVGWPRAVAVTLALAVKGGGPNLPQRRRINLGFFLTSVLAAWSSGSKELLTHKKLLFVFFFFFFFINSIYIGTKCVVLFNTPLILQYLIML